jgi:hypothetical protein
MTRNRSSGDAPSAAGPSAAPPSTVWTDDYSSIWSALRGK